MSSDNENQMKWVMNLINSNISLGINSIDDLRFYKEINLLSRIDDKIKNVNLCEYSRLREAEPKYTNSKFDHGVFGSLLFLKSMYHHFENKPLIHTRGDNTSVVTSRKLLENSLLAISVSIALHNLDSDDNVLRKSIEDNHTKIFNLDEDPLSYLLKICDEIQEWYKFENKEKIDASLYQKKLNPPNISIKFSNSKITIEGIENRERIKTKLEVLLDPPDIIEFL